MYKKLNVVLMGLSFAFSLSAVQANDLFNSTIINDRDVAILVQTACNLNKVLQPHESMEISGDPAVCRNIIISAADNINPLFCQTITGVDPRFAYFNGTRDVIGPNVILNVTTDPCNAQFKSSAGASAGAGVPKAGLGVPKAGLGVPQAGLGVPQAGTTNAGAGSNKDDWGNKY